MKVSIDIKYDSESDPNSEADKSHKLLKQIYKKFPESLWQKREGGAFEVFI
ncbi:MAG: hypothetical protein ACOYT4_03230 [Nanoarchaeota archaeon]